MSIETPPGDISLASTRTERAFQRESMMFFVDVMQLIGVPRSVGEIYGLLYASQQPLSFSDIVKEIDISSGSASQGLKLLRSLGAIKVADSAEIKARRRLLGKTRPRSVAYEPELSLRKLVRGILRNKISPLSTTGSDRLARLQEIAESDEAETDFYLERVRQLNSWRRRLKTVIPLLSALLGPSSE